MTIEPMLTNEGISLLLRAVAGEQITFTRFACGKGAAPSNPAELSDLVDRVMYFGIDDTDDSEIGYIKITGSFDSSDVHEDFQWTETGLYCKDENNVEKLYAYCNYGSEAGIILANDAVLTEQQVAVIVAIGTAEHVTAQISASALYAPKSDFEAHTGARNPHGTTAADVGLGNVPNVSTNDQTPTYAAAGTLSELSSGERMTIAFGKIKAAISALISHLASQNNPHEVTLAQIGGAAAGHTHGAADITSGILAAARGGTGGSTGRIVLGQSTSNGSLGTNATAEGTSNNSEGLSSHTNGTFNAAIGERSTAIGFKATAVGDAALATGHQSFALGQCSFVGGGSIGAVIYNYAVGSASFAYGNSVRSYGYCSAALGMSTQALLEYSQAMGHSTRAYNPCMAAFGAYNRTVYTTSGGGGSFSENYPLTSQNYPHMTAPTVTVEDGYENDLFVVGNGSDVARSNAFRVTRTAIFGLAYNSSGADYAEMFEWADGNPDGEDRVGRFVTLDGAKIRLAAQEDDFILGIVSGNPSVCADVYDDQWQGMYLRDVYGRPIMEDVYVPEELDEKGEIIMPSRVERRWKLNPDYDDSQTYIPRSQRKEWDAVGMVGKLVVTDDGTCTLNGWAAVGAGGVATAAYQRTSYRVMERLDASHIRVLIL